MVIIFATLKFRAGQTVQHSMKGAEMSNSDSLVAGLLAALPTRQHWLNNVQLSGGGQTFNDGNASGFGVGGRVGYAIPMGEDKSLTLGVSGGGSRMKMDTPTGKITKALATLNALDVAYRNKQNEFSAEVGFGPEKNVMLRYMREF